MAAEELRGDSLKQRLVGGIALLVIGVIAWFWLLSADSPVDPVSRTTQIPPAPDIQPFDVPEPKSLSDVPPSNVAATEAPTGAKAQDLPAASAPPVVERSSPNEAKSVDRPVAVPAPSRPISPPKTIAQKSQSVVEKAPVAKPKEGFELDQQGLPVAWVVQVGLFSTQSSADKVKATLQQKGFKAYSEAYKTANAPNGFKVFVGPKLSRERADEQKRAIDAALKVDSKVVRFQSPQR